MVVIRGRLEPETGAVLMKALDAGREALSQRARVTDSGAGLINKNVPAGTFQEPAAETLQEPPAETVQDPAADPPTFGQQQADALGLLAETALHHGIDPGAPGERYQVVIHVDASVLAETNGPADPSAPGQSALEDGAHVSAETSRRLACDATRVVMRHDPDGRVTEVGARARTIPPALRRALQHRDRGCRFPGCGLPFGQGHHIRHWAHGGPTTLSNLAMLCRRHHRAVHEDGYQVERQLDGALRFRRPDGLLLPDVPPPGKIPTNPVETLRAENDAHKLHIDARTAMPGWLGERLDVGYAIDVLHPLALAAGGAADDRALDAGQRLSTT
jgi:5-methylcytosine-specific restriction endonuclease McrA